MYKKLSVLLLFIVLCFVGVSMITSRKHGPKPTPLKIGVIYGFTGPASTWSEYGKKSLDLAAQEINNQGGVRGRIIELHYEDSKTDPKTGVSAFHKLVNVDDVDVIIGDVWAFLTNPLIPLSDEAKTVLISPTSNGETIEQESDYFFTLGHSIKSQRVAVVKFFETNPEIKTVSILCWDDSWGQAHSKLFREVIKERSIRLLSEECASDYSSNYRMEITKIKSQSPDAILMTVTSSLVDVALKRIKERDLKAKILMTNTLIDALETRNMPREIADGVYFTNWLPSQRFIDSFQKAYGTYPILEAQNHYETLKSIVRGFKNNTNNLLEGIRSVSYEGVGGKIDFTTNEPLFVNTSEAELYQVKLEGYTEIQ